MPNPTYRTLTELLQTWIAPENPVQQIQMVPLAKPLSIEKYKSWLEKKEYGNMDYLKTHLEQKEFPELHFKQYRSAIVLSHSYLPHPFPEFPWKSLRTAFYARGRDYHHWIKEFHQKIIQRLAETFPGEEFLSMVDSGPVLERDLAARAGLGWIGKNSMLIHPRLGSFVFISEIYTSLTTPSTAELMHDFCGTCNRCIEICPTQAIQDDRTLNADKCISYLTIEAREAPLEPLREKMGDHFFGCDLCQSICPWNQKVFVKNSSFPLVTDLLLPNEPDTKELEEIFSSSHNTLQKKVRGTALARAGAKGLIRNALIVVGNRKIKALKTSVQRLAKNESYKELCDWVLRRL